VCVGGTTNKPLVQICCYKMLSMRSGCALLHAHTHKKSTFTHCGTLCPLAAHPSHLCLGRVSRALSSRDTRSSTRFNKSSCGSCLPSGGRTGACPVALCTPHAGYLPNERENTEEHAFKKSIIAL